MDALGGLAEAAADRPALGGAKRGLGAEAPCWLVFAFAENCQHEAAAPRPRFAALRLRVRPCRDALQGRDRGSRRGLSEATSNSQHEAEAPRPRFAASRLRVTPCRSEARPQVPAQLQLSIARAAFGLTVPKVYPAGSATPPTTEKGPLARVSGILRVTGCRHSPDLP